MPCCLASPADTAAGEGSAEAGRPDMEADVLGGAGSHVAIYKRTRAALHMLSDMQASPGPAVLV